MPQIDKNLISNIYTVENNTFLATPKDNPKELLELEIGDIKQADFYPQVKIKNWNNETNLSIRLKDDDYTSATVVAEDGKIKWKKQNIEAHYYDIPKVTQSKKTPQVSVDEKNCRFIKRGAIAPEEIPALHELPREIKSGELTLSTYWMNEDALGFWSKKRADANIKDVDNISVPLFRYPTLRNTGCPVSLANANGHFLLDLHYPNVGDRGNEFLSLFEKSIISVLARYDVTVFRRDEELFDHILFYEKDGILYQVARMGWDDDNIIFYMYLDSPLKDNLLKHLRGSIILQDKILLPLGGLRELNPNITLDIVNEIAIEISNNFGFSLKEKALTEKENTQLQALVTKFKNPIFIKQGIWETKNRDDGSDAYEFDVVINEKPATNVLEFTIETKELDFLYQPELTDEEKELGIIRPDYVIGSYAVYHKEKKGDYSALGGNNYGAGKAFHIYRPQVRDANGDWVWADLDIDIENGLLKIITPKEFLDRAVYPVTIDPTFGYTTAGATTKLIANNQIVGSKFTSPEAGTVSKITIYHDVVYANQTMKMKGAIYKTSDGSYLCESAEGSWSSAQAFDARDFLISGSPAITAQEYLLAVYVNVEDGKGGNVIDLKYDTGSTGQGGYNNTGTYPTLPSNYGTLTTNTDKHTIYVTYTAGGGSSYSPSISPSLSPSLSPSVSQSISPSLSPSISPSVSPSQSISPSLSPSISPSQSPSQSISPSLSPSISPSKSPSISPSISVSISPSQSPSQSISPSISPSLSPSISPSISQSLSQSISPSISPSQSPSQSISPSISPSKSPSISPSISQSISPSQSPSQSISPSISPSFSPSISPSLSPSLSPSISPSQSPSSSIYPSLSPSKSPSLSPSVSPSISPSQSPSQSISPSFSPSYSPSFSPSLSQSLSPSKSPSFSPSLSPSISPSQSPSQSISPSFSPSLSPSLSPSYSPSLSPSLSPSFSPSQSPSQSISPSFSPSLSPSFSSSISPSISHSISPSYSPSYSPSLSPSFSQSVSPSQSPSQSISPSLSPSLSPSISKSLSPSLSPSISQSISPSQSPSQSISPSLSPSISPSLSPSLSPSFSASLSPSISPSVSPSISPSISPSQSPSASISPSLSPSISPSQSPSLSPSLSPSISQSLSPSISPSFSPSISPSLSPSFSPSISPSQSPSQSISPSLSPSFSQSLSPSISQSQSPSLSPSISPSQSPSQSISPSFSPSKSPSISPSISPSQSPSSSISPSYSPSLSPSISPSKSPSISPSVSASLSPSVSPSISPSISPSQSPSASISPSYSPSISPSISSSISPSLSPSLSPSVSPSISPSPSPIPVSRVRPKKTKIKKLVLIIRLASKSPKIKSKMTKPRIMV